MFTKLTHSGCVYVICFSVHMFHLESYVFNIFRLNLITREAFVFGEHSKPKKTILSVAVLNGCLLLSSLDQL